MLKVVVADDHELVRNGLVRLLENAEGIDVVGAAAGGVEALALARTLQPDILLLDITMADMDGLEVLSALHGEATPRVIMVSMHEDRGLIERTLATGAAGYVCKKSAPTELVTAMRAVGSGETYLCELARARLGTE